MKKSEARMAVMATITDNIDSNLELINKGDTDRYYLEIGSSSSISEMMKGQDQIFIDEANSEAQHGIDCLSYLKLLQEKLRKKVYGNA